MTLQEQNEACRLQSKMREYGFDLDFPRVFARCLPSPTDQVDWDAVVIFEAWAQFQPKLQDAYDFLNRILDSRKAERDERTAQIRTLVKLGGI